MIWAQPRFVPDTDIKKVGEVEFQVPRHFSLGFTNKGDKPLIIKEAKASCGCLDVSFPKNAIAAGSRGEIDITFDAKMLGSFYKEVEVLKELVTGAANKEIAKKLNMGESTVKMHITSMLQKSGFHSRLELALMARHYGIAIDDKDE